MRLADREGGAVRPLSSTDLRAATGPGPELDPITLFVAARRAGADAALLLQPDRGGAIVGIGAARTLAFAGPDRFARAGAAWRDLVAELRAEDPAAEPILLGGLGFTGRPPRADDVWGPFGPSALVLPELTWRRRVDGATVTVVGPGRPWDDLLAIAAARTDASTDGRPDALTPARPDLGDPPAARLRVVAERPDRPTWGRLVGMFAGAVGRGRLDKVVLARRVELASVDGRDLDVEGALRHLAATAAESTIYAIGRGGRGGPTFLVATPERLVRTVGRDFETVAIAGSAPRHRDPAEDARLATAFLGSEKDREEHAVVVAMLRESLAPLASELRIAPAPRLLELRHVRHLMTPVEGTLRDEGGLLALAGILHPTPAVGGEPRDLALELIAEHEGFDRGWYAGPIGWVGADGDGELSVALRCGIVAGARATLFAGCGIVADSDPEREWEESRMKLRSVGTALGGIDDGPRREGAP